MSRPTFLEGVAVALGASILGSILHTVLAPVLPYRTLMLLLISALGLGYLLYLLRCCPERIGRVTAVAVWTIVAGAAWWLKLPLSTFLLAQLGTIWLVRALYFQNSVVPALADLALAGFGLLAGIWAALHTGSLFLAIWCFFLVQALFVVIPPGPVGDKHRSELDSADRFREALSSAEAAVRKFSSID